MCHFKVKVPIETPPGELMNAEHTHQNSPKVRYAVRAWLVCLVIFLVWLVMTMSGSPSVRPLAGTDNKAGSEHQPSVDTGYVVSNLPAREALPIPDLPFANEAEYVLSGYGLQGMYQNIPGNKAWTLAMPAPKLAAQLVKRGDSPAVITENVSISWEMESQTVLEEGEGHSRKGKMELVPDGLSFVADVPVTAMEADGSLNPYPVLRIVAHQADSGEQLTASAAVVAISPGFGCALCHADAEFAVLEAHDRHQRTKLQEQARQSGPVNCRSCHNGIQQEGGKTSAGKGLGFSAAIHGWHTQYLVNADSSACLACHIGLGRANGKPEAAPRPLFARDLHIAKGLNCIDCHGSLEDHALALLRAEQEAGQKLATTAMAAITPRAVADAGQINSRLPWTQLPDCAGCHDFATRPKPGQASAFNKWTENTDGLFSARAEGTGVLRCPTCHGAPHALYPSNNPLGNNRDNMVPIQYQSHASPLGAAGNCALCHMQDMDSSAHHDLVTQ